MSNIYQDQTNIIVFMETGMDLSAASVTKILYKKPNGSKGAFNCSVSGSKLIYNAVAGDFNESGVWRLQACVTINGLDSYGAIVDQKVIPTLK